MVTMMDNLEKVERLREHADVTYEEARDALNAVNGDMLDAIVLLEKQGKTKKPDQSTWSTSYEEQTRYQPVREKVARQQAESEESAGKKIGRALKKLLHILKHNSFCVTRKGSLLFMMPAWVFALILLMSWRMLLPIMIISLFFWVRYSFQGEDDLSRANQFMDKVGNLADDVRDQFKN